jgi:hypothetical protein
MPMPWYSATVTARDPLMPDTSPTPVDPGDALSELYWLTDCHCDPAWTDRQLHAPDCNAYLRESVDVVAAELRSTRASIGPDALSQPHPEETS